jgi:hypothetical protein
MGFDPSTISDSDFVLSYLSEYLDGDLPKNIQPRFEELLKQPGQEEIPAHFQAMRGRLQLSIQSTYLRESEKADLHALVQDPVDAANQDAAKVEEIGKQESTAALRRKIILGGLLGIVVLFIAMQFKPQADNLFKPLEYLGYEAVAMEEDPGGRLDLPSKSIEEIRQYLRSYPGLGFQPLTLKKIRGGWAAEGTSVADYEVAKVSVVQYGRKKGNEKLFHFNYIGQLSDLPKSDPGNLRGLVYQAYANDNVNIIAWQHTSSLVSFLVGRLGAVELAEIAVKGK